MLKLPKNKKESRYFLQGKSKDYPKRKKWFNQIEADDRNHGKLLLNHPEFIANTPYGRNFHWRIVELKIEVKVLSEKTIMTTEKKKGK